MCYAKKECKYTTKNLTFPNPTSKNIANIYWQDTKEGYETIKRLYISYKDGSLALIEHKFCSMYNFEAAYYVKEKQEFEKISDIEKEIKSFFKYSSIQDNTLSEALEIMKANMIEKRFDFEKGLFTNHYDSNEHHQLAEFQIEYLPLVDTSFHDAALFIYMGIGGMH